MKRGYWALNHQPIAFDEEGNLLDGQHRLAAIVRSGKTIRMLVARNVPREFGSDGDKHFVQETIDGGKPRSIGDRINLSYGIANANMKSAVVSVLVNLCTGRNFKLSPAVTYEIIKTYQSEIGAVIEARGYGRGLVFAPVLGAFCFAAKVFKEETLQFESGYFGGENLVSSSPIYVFRNYMLNRQAWKGNGSYRGTCQRAALTSLMYYVQHLPLKRIIHSNQGVEFFSNKQKRIVSEISELFRL
jgi:hypothetical protein